MIINFKTELIILYY